jgi:hypothetical protein
MKRPTHRGRQEGATPFRLNENKQRSWTNVTMLQVPPYVCSSDQMIEIPSFRDIQFCDLKLCGHRSFW